MGRKFVPKPRQHVHRRAIPYAYPGAVRGQEEVPLDPDVVLGDLGGNCVSDFMTALRKNCYTPKKARSAAQSLVDKMKRDALRNPKYQRSASLPASAGARRIDLKLPASSHQGFRSPVKIEPRDEPLRAVNQYAPISPVKIERLTAFLTGPRRRADILPPAPDSHTSCRRWNAKA